MGKVSYSAGIDLVKGALDSDHILITRRKHLHDINGKQTKKCEPEMYYQRHKRDFELNPPQGAELAHLQHFGQAAKRTTTLLQALKFPETATDEQRQLLDQYHARFQAQLNGKPDPQAPLETKKSSALFGQQRRYYRFDNFIRAMILQELKNN